MLSSSSSLSTWNASLSQAPGAIIPPGRGATQFLGRQVIGGIAYWLVEVPRDVIGEAVGVPWAFRPGYRMLGRHTIDVV
jgi:hypothetical protein